MKEALLDIAQAAGTYVGAMFAVYFALSALGVDDLANRPGAVLLGIGSWVYTSIRVSLWRQRRRAEAATLVEPRLRLEDL